MRGRVIAALVGLGILWLINQGLIAGEDDAFDAVRLGIADLGHNPAEYTLLELDSSFGALGREIHAVYVPVDGEGGSLRVRAKRRLAFSGWMIHELSVVAPR